MKYWAYIDNEILGPYEKEKLLQLPGFTPGMLVCPQTPVGEKTGEWKEATTFPEIMSLINIPSGQSLKEPGEIKPAQATPAPTGSGGQDQPASESKPASAETPAGMPVAQEPKKLSPLTPKSLTPSSLQEDAKPTAEPQARDEVHEMRKMAGASFDPLTLSQIGRRFDEVKDDKPTPLPEEFSLSKPFLKKAPAPEPTPSPEPATMTEQAPAPEPAPATEPVAEQVPTPEPAPQQIEQVSQPPEPKSLPAAPEEKQEPVRISSPQSPLPTDRPVGHLPPFGGVVGETFTPTPTGIDPMTLAQVNQKLQDVINSGILKQDFTEQIKFIVQKIGHIEEEISIIQKSQFQKEIFDKISRLENSINEIKTKLAAKPEIKETLTPQKIDVKPASVSPALVQAAPKKEEVPPPKPQAPEKKEEIPEKEEKAKTSFIGNFFKKFLKLVMILVLICGVLAVAAFVLKQVGIIDVTNIIDIPFISKPQKTETSQKPQEPKPQAEFSQEAVNMVREYLLKPGGDKLETIINKEANKLQTDINFGEWKTVKISQDVYKVTISMPYNNGKSKLVYGFEVDFKNKIVKHLDEETKKLFELDKISQQQVTGQEKIQKPALKQPRKGRRGRKTPRIQPSPQKQVQQKPVQNPKEEDEEYEYVYEEEKSAPGEGTEEVIEEEPAKKESPAKENAPGKEDADAKEESAPEEEGAEEVVEEEPAEEEYMVPGVPKKQ